MNLSPVRCLSLQLCHPLALVLLSNTHGNFEYFGGRGKPYILIGLYDVAKEECLRVVTIDEAWMAR